MTYVITERCVGNRYTDCVVDCPVDCFYELEDPPMLIINPDECIDWVSSPGESHPQALSEPYVNVSAHTAPIIQPRVEGQVVASGQTGWALVERDVPASIPPAGDDLVTACISAGPTTEVVS